MDSSLTILYLVWTIDILYTQTGKVFRLPWELNLLLSCFGLSALYSRIYRNSWTCPLAWHPQQRYWHDTVGQGSVSFNLREEASAPSLYPSCCIIYKYLWLELTCTQTPCVRCSLPVLQNQNRTVYSVLTITLPEKLFYVPERNIMHLTVVSWLLISSGRGGRIGGGQWEGWTLRH